MTKKLLMSQLLAAVDERLRSNDFAYRKSDQMYMASHGWGIAIIHLFFITHPGDFDILLNVGVRIDRVENLINKYDARLSEKEKKRTWTLGVEVGQFVGMGQKRWTVAQADDVPKVARDIHDAIHRIALPYVEKYSNLENALGVLAGDGRDSWIHLPLHDQRAKRAVGLAWLLGDRERFVRIVETKRAFLSGRNDVDLEDFERFVGSLSEAESVPRSVHI